MSVKRFSRFEEDGAEIEALKGAKTHELLTVASPPRSTPATTRDAAYFSHAIASASHDTLDYRPGKENRGLRTADRTFS